MQSPELATISHFIPYTFTFVKLTLELGYNLIYRHLYALLATCVGSIPLQRVKEKV